MDDRLNLMVQAFRAVLSGDGETYQRIIQHELTLPELLTLWRSCEFLGRESEGQAKYGNPRVATSALEGD